MTETEKFVRSILEKSGKGLDPFVAAVDLTAKLLYQEGMRVSDILVTKHIYPVVAKLLHMGGKAASRSILRTAHDCWTKLSSEQKKQYIGRALHELDAPRDMLFYFAAYLHTGKPFYEDR